MRQTVFYPDKPGRNFITVRGFILRHAAPKWAPPTAEQMGLIGTHWSRGWVIEDNTISHCEQAGIVGSMGASFSRIIGNHIFKIHTQGRFSGAEMAGIKFHAPIDLLVEGNRIHDTCRGLWLDWMTQGTRVTRNLLYRNGDDAFLEVNGPPPISPRTPRRRPAWPRSSSATTGFTTTSSSATAGSNRASPFELAESGRLTLKVWPVAQPCSRAL